MPSGGELRFGPYRLDLRGRRLLRDGTPVPLQPRHFHLLQVLTAHPGEVVTSRRLTAEVWTDTFVAPNSLTKGICHLRAALDAGNLSTYIETVPRVGYRFAAPVTHAAAPATDADIDAVLASRKAALEGRAALETLRLDRVAAARAAYEALLAREDADPRSHVGLANACLALYEATRGDAHPDTGALTLAASHAREGVRLNLEYPLAWATLGQVLHRQGDRLGALAALRRATDLAPNDWVHYLRLGLIAAGRERLEAAERLLELMPGMPAAYWLMATVHIARGALGEAERMIDAAIAAVERVAGQAVAFPPVAVYWLKGLLVLARGAGVEARRWFARELETMTSDHIYGRETEANTWYAIGACDILADDRGAARHAFEQAIARTATHAMARAGLAVVDRSPHGRSPHGRSTRARLSGARSPDGRIPRGRSTRGRPADARAAGDGPTGGSDGHAAPRSIDEAAAAAVLLVADGDVPAAVRLVAAALRTAPPGHAGWTIPIDPLLGVQRDPDAWAEVLARLRERAMQVMSPEP